MTHLFQLLCVYTFALVSSSCINVAPRHSMEVEVYPPTLEVGTSASLPKSLDKPYETIYAYVTAYNLVADQTDSTPTIGAAGVDLRGHDRPGIACPSIYSFGTIVKILDNYYVCLDRMAPRFSERFDICLGEDVAGAKEFGIKYLPVKVYDNP